MGYVFKCQRCETPLSNYTILDDIKFKDEHESIRQGKHVLIINGILCKDCKTFFYNDLQILKDKYFKR